MLCSLRMITTAFLAATASVAGAAPHVCDNGLVNVETGDPALAAKACAAADKAFASFQACHLGLPGPLTISITDTIIADCLGLFHCGDARIEILSPAAIDEKRRPEGLFAHIPGDRLFDSVILHELAHALYDTVPCPIDNCMATSEYFAYTLQIGALSEADAAPILARMPTDGEDVPRDVINTMVALMAPDVFAIRAWTHFNQRPDQCAWYKAILDGTILFDHERP